MSRGDILGTCHARVEEINEDAQKSVVQPLPAFVDLGSKVSAKVTY